jgi:hypothetical protein
MTKAGESEKCASFALIKHYGHLVKSFRKEEIKKIEGQMDTCMDTWNKKGVTESRNPLNFKVPPAGIEPATPGLGNLYMNSFIMGSGKRLLP